MIDFAAARRMMVDGQVRTADVTDLRLLAAMLELPRERFFPDDKAVARLSRSRRAGERAGTAGPPPAQADGAGQADPGRRDRRRPTACSMSAAPPAIPPRCWRISPGPWWASRKTPGLARQAADALSSAGLPNAKIVTGPLTRGCAGEGPYDVIVLQGSAEIVPRGAVRSAQGRRPAGRRARPRSGRQGHALSPRSKANSAAGRCSTPQRRRCRASPSRTSSFSSCCVFEHVAATILPRAKGWRAHIFLCMTVGAGVC